MVCDLCLSIHWFELQPEDVRGEPHHKSRRALEKSAETCEVCRMILRAAVSNYQDSGGRKWGKGYWREFRSVTFVDPIGREPPRPVCFVTELGACSPAQGRTHTAWGGRPVLAPTGHINGEGRNMSMEEELPNLKGLKIDEDATKDMPVWLYGNWWAVSAPVKEGDLSHLRLMGVGARFSRSESNIDAFKTTPGNSELRGSSISICSNDGTAFSMIPGRLRELHSGSDLAFSRIERWLADCCRDHRHPTVPQWDQVLPTRVIDVLFTDRSVSLFESKGQRGRYMTLSHCWGTSPRLMATKECCEDLRNGIAISFLPKTFRDAIAITRRLKVRYLWIDCLCIIQDDPDDWEREASRMADVYRNSYLTIAAAGSTDSASGCFPSRDRDSYISPATASLGYDVPREARGPNSYEVGYEHTSQPGKRSAIFLFEEWMPGSSFHVPQCTQVGTFGKDIDPIDSQPLSSRAWTLQERLLSPRTIHYASDQLYYECDSGIFSEDGFEFPYMPFSLESLMNTEKIPYSLHGLLQSGGISFIRGQPGTGSTKGLRRRSGWLRLVEDFSRRLLSVDQDKLTALAGVARAVAEETGDLYLAGLWASHFYEDLNWRVYAHDEPSGNDKACPHRHNETTETYRTISRPSRYRAPSWSWACIDAAIGFIPLSYSSLVAEVVDCISEPAGVDSFGRVSGGKLILEAPVFEIFPHTPAGEWKQHGIPVQIDLEDKRGISVGAVHLDFPEEPVEYPCYALFLDPANALIIKSSGRETYRDASSKNGVVRTVPKRQLTSRVVGLGTAQEPKLRGAAWKSTNDAMRIGIGAFVKGVPKEQEAEAVGEEPPEKWDEKKHGKLKLENILHVSGSESWGPVTDSDSKVWITIV